MLQKYGEPIRDKLDELKGWQQLYCLAIVLAVFEFVVFDSELSGYWLVGAVALAGLAVELWPKFVSVWETLLGRILILMTYAILGHFVVAFANHELNKVVGVDPGPLIYATSFVSLLTAPLWILTLTLVAMLTYVMVQQAWFFLTLIPRFLGLYRKSVGVNVKYPKFTRIGRLALLPFMMFSIVSSLETYGGNFGPKTDEFAKDFMKDMNLEGPEKPTDENSTQSDESEMAAKSAEDESNTSLSLVRVNDFEITTATRMESIIATFVHYVEGFQYSQCEKTDKERVLPIGEYDILVSTPDKTEPKGYRFSVRPCQLKTFSVDKLVEKPITEPIEVPAEETSN